MQLTLQGPGKAIAAEFLQMMEPDGFLDFMRVQIYNLRPRLTDFDVEWIALDIFVKLRTRWWLSIMLHEVRKIDRDDCVSDKVLGWRNKALSIFAIGVWYSRLVCDQGGLRVQCGIWNRARTTIRNSGSSLR